MLRIIELRSYASAKAAYDQAGGKIDQLEAHPMIDAVIDNVFRAQRERLADGKDGEG